MARDTDTNTDMDMDTSAAEATVDSQIVTSDQITYWSSISPDVTGMLGGYPQVSRIDIQGSRSFIHKLRRLDAKRGGSSSTSTSTSASTSTSTSSAPTLTSTSTSTPAKGNPTTTASPSTTTTTTKLPTTAPAKPFRHALEPGAGIGRVTTGLLAPLCHKIDIIEPIETFTRVLSSPSSLLMTTSTLATIHTTPLQSWTPPRDSPAYDLIWNQWCLNHLSLPDLIVYLRQCVSVLAPDGWIVVKENLSTHVFGHDLFDEEDSSVTRSDGNWRRAFEGAGLRVVRTELQTGFPRELGLYPVRMYALRPKEKVKEKEKAVR